MISSLFSSLTSHSEKKNDKDVENFDSCNTSKVSSEKGVHFNIGPNGKLPTKGTSGAAGYDVYSAMDVVVKPSKRALISTDLKMAFSGNIYCQLKSRSGNAVKGIDVAAGVIDSDYRGEVKVLIVNNSEEDFNVKKGDRIAQILFIELANVNLSESRMLNSTERGGGGFGSTGI